MDFGRIARTKRRAGELFEGQTLVGGEAYEGAGGGERRSGTGRNSPDSRADLRDSIAKERRGDDKDVRRACPQTVLRGVKTINNQQIYENPSPNR